MVNLQMLGGLILAFLAARPLLAVEPDVFITEYVIRDRGWAISVWVDRNHDGISQPEELETLAERGVLGIELHYVESRRRDEYGNELRWASRVQFSNRIELAASDVILQEADTPPRLEAVRPSS